jgi:hypothetical protein
MWQTPIELIRTGFKESDVVMMNEAHDGWKRCCRTRTVGEQILETAFAEGARYLAMEALTGELAKEANSLGTLPCTGYGYLRQPDMQSLIMKALQTGFTLVAYEADDSLIAADLPRWERAKLRDVLQAENLAAALPVSGKVLVWVGNGHLVKTPLSTPVGEYPQMAFHFCKLTKIDPFCIDQTLTVDWEHCPGEGPNCAAPFQRELERLGGTAGFLKQDAPPPFDEFTGMDAFVLSLFNSME